MLEENRAKTCSQSSILNVQKPAARARSAPKMSHFVRFGPVLAGLGTSWHILPQFATFWHIFGTLRQPSEIVGRLVLSGDYKPTKTSRF